MREKSRIISSAILCVVALGTVTIAPRAASHEAQGAEEPVPAFHKEATRDPLPETLDPSQFPNVVVQNAYTLAARVKRVLYQQP